MSNVIEFSAGDFVHLELSATPTRSTPVRHPLATPSPQASAPENDSVDR